jgi:pimeloyl-ACP methyl ester carboxylesterase
LSFISIQESPLCPGVSPIQIYYREYGQGSPVIFLHGGWGYEVYPFDRQIESFGEQFKMFIPDRSGYGRSVRLQQIPTDFHRRAATETLRVLDALELEKPVLWGHSDGAVIAALMGLEWPDRFAGLILEAFHFYRYKPGSREFFETMAQDPRRLGERVSAVLAQAHGEDYWQTLIVMNGNAWLRLADQSSAQEHDLYEGRLSKLQPPALFLHGSRDPRTEPGELDAVRSQLPRAEFAIIQGGGHSPHSESASAGECNNRAMAFLELITNKPVESQ